MSHITWQIDYDAVRKARKKLKLYYPVETQTKAMAWDGEYEPLHLITINSTLEDPVEVTFTIWHEMVHALQCERDFNCNTIAFMNATEANHKLVGPAPYGETAYADWLDRYYQMPLEKEAETLGQYYGHKYPLVRC